MTNNFNEKYGFTLEEWNKCLKVLETLKNDPLNNPNNKQLSGLITKVHKTAKKKLKTVIIDPNYHKNRHSNINKQYKKSIKALNRQSDLEIIKNSSIVKNALTSKSFFQHLLEKISFTPLKTSQNCYICSKNYKELHSFYHKLCPSCATLNYKYRAIAVDLSGRNIILTGGRVKVGFSTALRFLRSHANLIITTRFPALALKQFKKEKDYTLWKDKLTIYGLDLRSLSDVETFIGFYKKNYTSLDILVNNSAQTIKYTQKYYIPLIEQENKLLLNFKNEIKLITNHRPITNQEINALTYVDNKAHQKSPLNRFGQPIDFREKNSWNSTLTEISTEELLEVNLINQISPYLLIKAFTPLFKASSFKEKFIINISSSEGQFSYLNKTIYHPHTNMTKSALNMLTRTSALSYQKDNIFISSVDVGWVSTGLRESKRKEIFKNGNIPPLDSVDASARIIHPIYEAIINKNYLFGVLLKNFTTVNW